MLAPGHGHPLLPSQGCPFCLVQKHKQAPKQPLAFFAVAQPAAVAHTRCPVLALRPFPLPPLPMLPTGPCPRRGPPPLPCTRMQLEEYLKCLFYSCSYNTVSLWPRTVAPQQSWEEGWLLTLWQKKKGRESLCRTSQAPCASPGHHSRAKESVPPLLVPTGHPRGSGSPVAACASGCTATCGTITLNAVGASDPSPGHGRGQGLTAGAAENRLKQ